MGVQAAIAPSTGVSEQGRSGCLLPHRHPHHRMADEPLSRVVRSRREDGPTGAAAPRKPICVATESPGPQTHRRERRPRRGPHPFGRRPWRRTPGRNGSVPTSLPRPCARIPCSRPRWQRLPREILPGRRTHCRCASGMRGNDRSRHEPVRPGCGRRAFRSCTKPRGRTRGRARESCRTTTTRVRRGGMPRHDREVRSREDVDFHLPCLRSGYSTARRHLIRMGLPEGRAVRGACDAGAAGGMVRESVEPIDETQVVRIGSVIQRFLSVGGAVGRHSARSMASDACMRPSRAPRRPVTRPHPATNPQPLSTRCLARPVAPMRCIERRGAGRTRADHRRAGR